MKISHLKKIKIVRALSFEPDPTAVGVPMDLGNSCWFQRNIRVRCVPKSYEKVPLFHPLSHLYAVDTFCTPTHEFVGHCTGALDMLGLNPHIDMNSLVTVYILDDPHWRPCRTCSKSYPRSSR